MSTLEFPGLWDLKLNIDRVMLSIYGFNVYWYGFIISAGLFLSIFLALKACEKYGIKKDDLLDFFVYVVPSSIICARLYYVAFKWEDFQGDFLKIINLRTGGLAIYGAVLGAIISAYIYTKVKKYKTLRFFDFIVVYLPLGQAIGRWGNFFNQEAFGSNTSLPWGMTSVAISEQLLRVKEFAINAVNRGASEAMYAQALKLDPNMPVHPTFLYESLWNFGVFALLLFRRPKKKFEGEIFALYMALYGLGRFFIEGLRTDSLMYGSVRISQFLAILFFSLFTAYIIKKRRDESKCIS